MMTKITGGLPAVIAWLYFKDIYLILLNVTFIFVQFF